ncbi:hypothetical protein SK128_003069 [Halocaridina rubra]|uniref:Carbohydrate sulfotransferase n=1 Tax=Halocaridina rubra TaxID=373956 RepID=A0AAN8WDU4_HALRR
MKKCKYYFKPKVLLLGLLLMSAILIVCIAHDLKLKKVFVRQQFAQNLNFIGDIYPDINVNKISIENIPHNTLIYSNKNYLKESNDSKQLLTHEKPNQNDSHQTIKYKTIKTSNYTDLNKQKDWKQLISDRFSSRMNHLHRECAKARSHLHKPLRLSDSFFYAKKYNLLACASAKGGVTTWKSHFLKMNGINISKTSVHSPWAERQIVAVRMIGQKGLKQIQKGSTHVTRILSVRHPISRLVSAYSNKFADGKNASPHRYYLMKKVLKHEGIPVTSAMHTSISFLRFLKYVIYEKSLGTTKMNIHWRPTSNSCDPCRIPYSYIIQLETLEEDLGYLVLQLGIKEIDARMRRNKSSKREKEEDNARYQSYFTNLDPEHVENLDPEHVKNLDPEHVKSLNRVIIRNRETIEQKERNISKDISHTKS